MAALLCQIANICGCFCCSEIKQRNEGGWDFFWDEESRPGFVILDVHVAKHLDSSLMDVDVHPNYISIVIKSKVVLMAHDVNSVLNSVM